MIPELDPTTGSLPPGIHEATWDEIVDRFATGEHRHAICQGLETALQIFRAAGSKHVHLGGSFVTAKAEPRDFDGCYDDESLDEKKLSTLSSYLPARLPGHLAPESDPNPTGDGLPCLEFFQHDPRNGMVMGVIYLDLATLPHLEEGSPARRLNNAADPSILAPGQESSLAGGGVMAQDRQSGQDVSRQLAERAARDPQFRQQLIDNPRQAVRDELGMEIPRDVEITVLEENPSQVYVILPSGAPSGQGLSDADLEQASGGTISTIGQSQCNPPTTISKDASGKCIA